MSVLDHTSSTCSTVPIAAPNVGVIMRIRATQIRLSWEQPSSEETLTSYLVRYRVVESRVTRNLDDTSTILEVSGTETVIQGLEPHLKYGVSVAGKTARGIGNYSEETVVGCKELIKCCIAVNSFSGW